MFCDFVPVSAPNFILYYIGKMCLVSQGGGSLRIECVGSFVLNVLEQQRDEPETYKRNIVNVCIPLSTHLSLFFIYNGLYF